MSKNSRPTNRRTFNKMVLGGAGLVAVASREATSSVQAAESVDLQNEALKKLMEGNSRFVSGEVRHPHSTQRWRQRLTEGQRPFATILGCSDSRVPPEILFDQGFGDLFVIRVAGNVVAPDVAGSVEYGVDHLQTRVVLVVGHERCGAVTAALESKAVRLGEPKEIQTLVAKISPALKGISAEGDFDAQLSKSVEANVRWSVRQLSRVPDLAIAVSERRTMIVGAVYELATGHIRILKES